MKLTALREELRPEVRWLLILSILYLASGMYQQLFILELSAANSQLRGQLYIYVVLGLVNVCYGAGAALSVRQYPAGLTRRAASWCLAIAGSSMLLSLWVALKFVVQLRNEPALQLLFHLCPAGVVFLSIGWLSGLLYAWFSDNCPLRLGDVIACTFLSLLAGYGGAALLTVPVGVNAAIATLGAMLIILPLCSFAGRARHLARLVSIAVVTTLLIFLPVDRTLEAMRVKTYSNLTQKEAKHINRGQFTVLCDTWSNMGKLDIYRLETKEQNHIIGCYNYQRVWRFGSHERFLVDVFRHLAPTDRVLAIGAGGGRPLSGFPEAIRANLMGVELNRQVVDFFKQHPEHNDGLFQKIEVRALDGRTVLEQAAPASYDLIVVHNTNTGTQVLSNMVAFDDYLSTREAIERYYTVLSPKGTLIFLSQWPVQLRQIADAVSELDWKHRVYASRSESEAIRLDIDSDADLNSETKQFVGVVVACRSENIDSLMTPTHWQRLDRSAFPERWVRTDDRPQLLNPVEIWRHGEDSRDPLGLTHERQETGLTLLLATAGFAFIGLLFAVGLIRWRSSDCEGFDLFYFFRIGIGFVLLQFYLITGFRSFFGDPMRTALCVNVVFLTGAAAGSLWMPRLVAGCATRGRAMLCMACICMYSHAALTHLPFGWTSIAARMLACLAVVGPISVVAGVFLPRGLTLITPMRMGVALLLDSMGSFLGIPIFYLTTWSIGMSCNIVWIAVVYLAATSSAMTRHGRIAARTVP